VSPGVKKSDKPQAVGRYTCGISPLRGVPNEPPPAKGDSSSRPKVTRLVRYGPVRPKTNIYMVV